MIKENSHNDINLIIAALDIDMVWLRQNIYWITLILTAFSLPFSMLSGLSQESDSGIVQRLMNFQWNSFFVLSLLLYWILEGKWRQKIKQLLSCHLFWFFALYYLVYLIGLLYTNNLEEGKQELILKSTIFIFPLIFASIQTRLDESQFEWVIWSFCIAVVLASLITFREGFTVIIDKDSGIPVLEKLVILHRPYLGMYIVFVIFYFSTQLYNYQYKNQEKYLLPAIMYLLIFLFLLKSKIALIALLFTALFVFSLIMLRRRKSIILLIFYTALFLLVFQYYYFLEHTVHELTHIYLIDDTIPQTEPASDNQARKNIWNCSHTILKDNQAFWFGMGTGDVEDQLLTCYASNGMKYELMHQFNAHNEFLQELLRHGIFGLIIFLLLICFTFWIGVQRANYFYISFILIFCVCSMTESMLSRQAGVVFFTFFNTFLLFKSQIILQKNHNSYPAKK